MPAGADDVRAIANNRYITDPLPAWKQIFSMARPVVTWSLATVASGLAAGFWSLLVARVVVGVGEASYLVLAPTIIDDVTPLDRKGESYRAFSSATCACVRSCSVRRVPTLNGDWLRSVIKRCASVA